MRIPLDRQSAVPLYRQIESYLRQSILSGSLAPDTQLPAIRRLARDLGINRITVENAYADWRPTARSMIAWSVSSVSTTLLPPT